MQPAPQSPLRPTGDVKQRKRIGSPASSLSGGISLPNLHELPNRTQIKVKAREDLYDFPEAMYSREALARKVLPAGRNLDKLNKKGHHHADEVATLIRAEQQRADDRANKKWTNQFEQWKDGALRKGLAPLEDPAATNQPPDTSPELITAPECRTRNRLSGELGRLGEELSRLNDELQKEQSLTTALERRLQAVMVERDGWRTRAIQSEESVQKEIHGKQFLTKRISEMSQSFARSFRGVQGTNTDQGNTPSDVVD